VCGDPAVQTLRKMVTDDKMAISHPMFEYVGEEAYTAAGGTLTPICSATRTAPLPMRRW
jgi:hypothetical protein